MYWSGPIIAAFVVYHLMQFTFGVGGTPYQEADAYGNVINGFRVPIVAIFYIIAMGMLCLHLRHGLWSMVQSLGFAHPRHTPAIQRARFGGVAVHLLRVHLDSHRGADAADSSGLIKTNGTTN